MSPEGPATPESAGGGRGERSKLICIAYSSHMQGATPSFLLPHMDILAETAEGSARATGRRDQRDRSGRTQDRSGRKPQDRSGRKQVQDRSGRKQVQDRSGRKQTRVQQSGHANRLAKRQKAEAALNDSATAAAKSMDVAASSTTAGSTAAGSAVLALNAGSTNAGSTNAGSTAAGSASDPSAADSSAADSSAVDIFSSATVSSAVVSSTAVPFSALSSVIVSSTADTRAASDDEDDPDAGWGSDGYCSSGLDLPMGETYIPLGEDEAELREHDKRGEHRAARERDRALRAEINAADRAAADSASAMQAIFPQPGEDDIVHGLMTDYDISRLHTTVTNEQGFLSLGLISSAQLSNSKHRLEQALELQSSQQALLREKVGHAVVTAAIACAIRGYYNCVV